MLLCTVHQRHLDGVSVLSLFGRAGAGASSLQHNGTRWNFTGAVQRDKSRHLKNTRQQRLFPEIMTRRPSITHTSSWQRLTVLPAKARSLRTRKECTDEGEVNCRFNRVLLKFGSSFILQASLNFPCSPCQLIPPPSSLLIMS